MAWNTIGSFFYQGCMWLLTVLVVRLSSDYQNSGALAFAMSVGNVFYMLATYNLRTYQVADTTEEYSPSNYVAIRLITIAAAVVICIPYSIIVSPSSSTLFTILAFLLFKSDESFANVLYGIDQQRLRLDISGMSQILRGIACVSAFALFMLLTDSLQISLLAMALSCLAVTLLFDLPRTNDLVETLRPRVSVKKCKKLLIHCLPSALGIVISNFVVSTARQLFGISYGEAALGIYASVATPCVVVQVLAQNLYTPMLGPIASLFKDNKGREARHSCVKLFSGLSIGCFLLSTVVFLCAKPLLTIVYGEGIANYSYLMPGVLAVASCSVLLCLQTDLLIVFDGIKMSLLMNAAAFLVMIASLNPMIDRFYMNGISFSLCLAYIVAMIIGFICLARCSSTQWQVTRNASKARSSGVADEGK